MKDHLVPKIYDFFKQNLNPPNGRLLNIYSFMQTIPEFHFVDDPKKIYKSKSYYVESLCSKMVSAGLLTAIKIDNAVNLNNVYLSTYECNFTDPEKFRRLLDSGYYDYYFNGFTYVYEDFKDSVIPIIGIKDNGDVDIGTTYYIGNNIFVTAAHCILGLEKFKLQYLDGRTINIDKIALPAHKDYNDFDLAFLFANDTINLKPFSLTEPNILDEVLVMGYPPIPGINPILTAETASVNSIFKTKIKATVGQVVSPANSYFSDLDFFIINARVKGGNSGGPVINGHGQVIGTVVQIPFDNQGGSQGGRYDIMGYGVCLPSKYLLELEQNAKCFSLVLQDGYNLRPHDC